LKREYSGFIGIKIEQILLNRIDRKAMEIKKTIIINEGGTLIKRSVISWKTGQLYIRFFT
jgi:hypothetical protein